MSAALISTNPKKIAAMAERLKPGAVSELQLFNFYYRCLVEGFAKFASEERKKRLRD